MLECKFTLNGKPLSNFEMGAELFPAFSGTGKNANVKASACLKGAGPIPPGTYYIVDRPSGGVLGFARDWLGNKGDWFALLADDHSIDDSTLCDKVVRGNFRLHPKGPLGLSEGCITIDAVKDFIAIRKQLKALPKQAIPNSSFTTYAKVIVS